MTEPEADENLSIQDYAKKVFGDTEKATLWMGTASEELNAVPQDLIGTPDEPKVREALARIDFGIL